MTIKSNPSKTENSKPPSESKGQFPVVAIGASAGGLEAMMELLNYLPSDTGMAFIYVQHLSPDHKSMLSEILSKKTKMQVQEIDDMDQIKPNNVFVIPYNKGIEFKDGHIKLIPRSDSVTAISIDILFSSLAFAQKERVIGIILSGSASDGSVGIKDIKHEGGLTFAQNDTAKFKSMPQSAIATGAVDFILSPKEMALELARLSQHPFVKPNGQKSNSDELIENNDPDLIIIIDRLKATTGIDFGVYKMNTIKRRIIRRMLLYKITTLKQYAHLLEQKNEETNILYQDLLINVTTFFRDTDTHIHLKESLFPKLLKRKKAGEPLRIWVPACSTGEEAYSIAMILLEIQEEQIIDVPIQIFATDLSESAINRARSGVYTKKELETVSPKRIQRFFMKTDGNFRVHKALRDLCVFAQHNVLSDPPFSRLDFISCCNLFIYLDNAAQKKALNTFHYALHSDGYLMLGKSENISQSAHLFINSNKKYKIFSRKSSSSPQRLPELSDRITQHTIEEKKEPIIQYNKRQKNISDNRQGLDNAIDAVLVSEFMPASVVINYQWEIVQFRGVTDLFLTHPKGKATFNILKMARTELAFELRIAISKVMKTHQRLRKTGIEVKINAELKIISLEVVPLTLEWNEPLILVIFTEQEQVEVYTQQGPEAQNSYVSSEASKDRRIIKLEQELAAAQADALAISQEHEAVTEELQSAHEEVVSSNEELQTVNEELETSKEEIESANEELTTTNQELQTRNDLLHESYEYSNAIVSTMHEPMLVLGHDLRVKSANKVFYEKFGVNELETVGELLYDLGNKQWNIPALRELLEDIIPKNAQFYNYEVKHTFQNIGEKIMSLNASRVIQKTHREQLILLIISDITEVRRLLVEKELREKEILTNETNKRKTEKLRLEKAVKERTQELNTANQSLEEKNKALLNMNKELEAFAYVSSHDLQEPLRKLQIFAGIILEKESQNLSNKGKSYLELMQQAAERMQLLIQDLLSFSRISVAERQFETTDLRMILEDLLSEFRDDIEEKNAVIDIIETCEVHIIPFQFRQLMHNLLSNALKFSIPGVPPHITIKSRNIVNQKLKLEGLNPQKNYSHISITDKGIGFEQKYSTKIFEVFQKLHSKEEYPGTGIGLAIVKKIIDNHNGVITATSKLNKGTTFNIYIPNLHNK